MDAETKAQIDGLKAEIDRLKSADSGFTFGDVISQCLSLYSLWAFWPCTAFAESGSLVDISGQGRNLTYSGAGGTGMALTADIPFLSCTGAIANWTRTNETGLQITAGICLFGWFYSAANATQLLMGKSGCYELYWEAGGNLLFRIWNGGVSHDVRQPFPLNTWGFAAGIFTPSVSSVAYVNGSFTSNTTTIPATLTSNTNVFQIGGVNVSANTQQTLMGISAYSTATRTLARIYKMSRTLFGV